MGRLSGRGEFQAVLLAGGHSPPVFPDILERQPRGSPLGGRAAYFNTPFRGNNEEQASSIQPKWYTYPFSYPFRRTTFPDKPDVRVQLG